jgi:hypothetical protein
MRRGSIARLMTAIGLSDLALVLLRGWLGPACQFGFLGLFGLLVLVTWIVKFAGFGVLRRFSAGFGMVASACWVAVLIVPGPILDLSRDWLILPIYRWALSEPAVGTSNLGIRFHCATLWGNGAFLNDTVTPTSHRAHLSGDWPDLQAYLLIPMVILAILGGLVSVGVRPRPIVLPSPVLPS